MQNYKKFLNERLEDPKFKKEYTDLQDEYTTVKKTFNFDFAHALFPVPRNSTKNDKRNKLICDLRDFGFTYQEIGDLFKISRQRVEQIYKRWKNDDK